jgi:P4 family phage/plasmid primase-like protien
MAIKQYDENDFIYFSCVVDTYYNDKNKLKKRLEMPKKWNLLDSSEYNKDKNGVCILTGEKSKLFVLDYDDRNLFKEHCKIYPELLNYYVKTKNGFHSYFIWEQKLEDTLKEIKKEALNVDMQGNGQCVIAPPTKYVDSTKKYKYKLKANNKLQYMTNDLFDFYKDTYLRMGCQKETKELKQDKNEILQLGDIIDIKYLDNYNDWIKIIWSLKTQNLYDEAKIISQRSKKYVDEDFDKYYNSFKESKNNFSLNTFYYYAKISNQKEFYKIKSKNDNFNIYEDLNQSDLAKLYYSLQPYKYCRGDEGWYEYNENNILVYKCNNKNHPSSLLNDITDKLQNHITNIRNQIKPDDNEYSNKMKIYKQAYKKLGQSLFIKGIIDYLKNLYYVDKLEDLLNKNNSLLCFENCVYDISTKKFRQIEPDDYITITTGYKAPTKSNTNIRKDINDLLFSIFEDNEMVEYYKIINGLSLFTTKLQSLYVHTGTGGNGKGILSTILRLCLGSYFLTAENTFLTTPYKAGQPNSTLFNSKDKRYLFISEPDNGKDDCKFNIDFIKTMTGGDPITTRGLYKENITYIPKFSAHIQCNNRPKLGNLDKGILRRLKIIPYRLSFVDNPKHQNERKRNYNLTDSIQKQDFINEFILMLIEKAEEHYNFDYSKLSIPSTVENETKEYLNENNPILDWLDNKVEITNDSKDRIKTSEIHKKYNDDDDIERHLNKTDMCKYMVFNGFEIKKIKGIRYYTGCKFKENYTNVETDDDTDDDRDDLNKITL